MFGRVFSGRLPLFGALMVGSALAGITPAAAACSLDGVSGSSILLMHCGADYVDVRVTSDATLTVDNLTTGTASHSGVGFRGADTAGNPADLTVNLTGTTVITSPDYNGVDIRSIYGDITLNIGADVLISPAQNAVYVMSADSEELVSPYVSGDVIIRNYGTVIAGPLMGVMGTDGIDGLSNGGNVTIYNYGSVTTLSDALNTGDPHYWPASRGIVADGGNNALNLVQVSIFNSGEVHSTHDGLRVNSYNGLGLAVNEAGGTIISDERRGVVVWSKKNDARFENYGSVIAMDGPGANIWAEGLVLGSATLINGGSIISHDDPDSSNSDGFLTGVHVWSEVKGDANLTNLAGGSIIAENGAGAWMASTNGDVTVDNAGLIKGKTHALFVSGDGLNELLGVEDEDDEGYVADYKGAVGGDISVTNSGLLTAFETISSPLEKSGIVTLNGDVGTLTFSNTAGGIVGAGLDLSNGFDAGLLTQSLTSRTTLATPASNMAIYSAATSDETSIDNAGTIIGRIRLDTPDYAYLEGPTTSGTAEINNSGLWVTSGNSAVNGGFTSALLRNSGDLWSVGEASLAMDVDNAGGRIVVAGTTGLAPELKIDGNYKGLDDGTVAFMLDSGSTLSSIRMLAINGNVSGLSKVDMLSIAGWDWQSDSSIDLIRATGSIENGAASFSMARPVVGLVHYDLNFDNFNQIWSLSASLSEQSQIELGEVSGGVAQAVTYLNNDIVNRTDDLRDLFDRPSAAPMGYAETKSTPADAAFAALTPSKTTTRFWSKGGGAAGSANGYDRALGFMELGADISTSIDGGQVGGGVFGGLSSTHLDFNGSTTEARVVGYSAGLYGTYVNENGLFVSATAAIEHSDIDLSLSDMPTNLNAFSYGGRAELGYRLSTDGFTIEPSVAIRASSAQMDGFDMNDIEVSFADRDLLATEARLRLATTIATETYDVTPFVVLSLGNETGGGNSVSLSGYEDVAAAEANGLYGGLAAGVALDSADGLTSGYLRGDVTGNGDAYLASLKLGGSRRF